MIAGSLLLVLAASIAQVDAQVTVAPLNGAPVSGTLKVLSSDAVHVQDADGTLHQWTRRELRRLDFAAQNSSSAPPAVVVQLVDGSRIACRDFVTSNRRATLTTATNELNTGSSDIASVLLQDPGNNDSLRQQWLSLLEEKQTQDLLVFPREIESSIRLDTLEGIIHDVSADTIDFTFNDQRSDARRSRVFGLIFFRAPGDAAPPTAETVCRLTDTSGSTWNVASYQFGDAGLQWTTTCGVTTNAPLSSIQSIDFAAGNLLYLSDLAFESSTWQPFVESRVEADLLEKRYAPRRDQAFDGGPLRLAGQTYGKGLAMRSRSEVSYRLTEEFQRFRAIVGIDDRVREQGIAASVHLVVRGDDQTLYDGKLGTGDKPLELDLGVTGVRRLRILVDYSTDLDIGDYLHFCDARLTK